MTGLLSSPARRITVAIVLSVLVHAAILWLPGWQFRHAAIELPPLSVRLEPPPHPRPADKSKPADPELASPLTKPDRVSPTRPGSNAMAAMSKSAGAIAPHPFPRHPQLNGEFFAMPVSDGTQLQQYQVEIGTRQDLATPLGKLRVLHLRKMHAPGESYFEIWLGLQYRMLPVKFRLVDSANQVTEEYLISDIRAGDK